MSIRIFIALTLLTALFLPGCSGARSSRETANLKVEAQIIYNMGGPQPVAQETFHLLDMSFQDLVNDPSTKKLIEESQNNPKGTPVVNFLSMIAALNKSRADNSELNAQPMMKAFAGSMPMWQPHIVKTAQTDFHGQARFQDIAPGDYWVTGITQTRAGFALWNYKVSLHQGDNDLSLSQSNAFYSR